MYVFKAINPTQMAQEVYDILVSCGTRRASRNGPVIYLPAPVSMTYTDPCQRNNSVPGRDSNPIFHHMESLWMLAGRQDVGFISQFNKGMAQYSDDGLVFNAAYGFRARHHFGFDQIQEVIWLLQEDPDSRQGVVQLWDPTDLVKITKDKACNMSMVFTINKAEEVALTVFNRSNDAVYGGVTGTNPVHFSYFLQYVAEQLSRGIGNLTFISNNLHVYTELYDKLTTMDWTGNGEDDYYDKAHRIGELRAVEDFCHQAMRDQFISTNNTASPMINKISIPMYNYWLARQTRNQQSMWHYLEQIDSVGDQEAIKAWEISRS